MEPGEIQSQPLSGKPFLNIPKGVEVSVGLAVLVVFVAAVLFFLVPRKVDGYFWSKGLSVYYTSLPGNVSPNLGAHAETLPEANSLSFKIVGAPLTLTRTKGEYGAIDSSIRTEQYYKDKSHVYLYCGITDSNGEFNYVTQVDEADPATFTPVNAYYAKDQNHVWFVQCDGYQNTNILALAGADPASFEAPANAQYGQDTAHDKSQSYAGSYLANNAAAAQSGQQWPWFVNRFQVYPASDGIYFGFTSADRSTTIKNVKLSSLLADTNTFDFLAENWGATSSVEFYKDKNHIYQVQICGDENNNSESLSVLNSVDASTFNFLAGQNGDKDSYLYAADKNSVYIGAWQNDCTYAVVPIEHADPKSFVPIRLTADNPLIDAQDNKYAYEKGKPLLIRLQKDLYKSQSGIYQEGIYTHDDYGYHFTSGIDSPTFEPFSDSFKFDCALDTSEECTTFSLTYYADKNSLYSFIDSGIEISLEPVQGADIDSFIPLNVYYAKDKNHVYSLQRDSLYPIDGADPNSFQLISGETSYDARDLDHRYLEGAIVTQ